LWSEFEIKKYIVFYENATYDIISADTVKELVIKIAVHNHQACTDFRSLITFVNEQAEALAIEVYNYYCDEEEDKLYEVHEVQKTIYNHFERGDTL